MSCFILPIQAIDFLHRQAGDFGYHVRGETLGFHGTGVPPIGFAETLGTTLSTTLGTTLSTTLSTTLGTTLGTTFSTLREDIVAQDDDIVQVTVIGFQFVFGHTIQFLAT